MNIFGLSSVDALISILLLETGWWGRELFEKIIPDALQITLNGYYETKFAIGFTVYILKFLIHGILWYAFLRNEVNKHGRLMKIWCFGGISLDIFFVSLIMFNSWKNTDILFNLVIYILIRIAIWIQAMDLISDLSHKDKKHLFPVSFMDHITDHLRTEPTLVLLLTWEFIWNSIFTTGIISNLFFIEWTVVLPHPVFSTGLTKMLLVAEAPVAFFYLLGITKHWKFCLKLGLTFYVIVNVFGYALVSFLDILHLHALQIYYTPLPEFAALGARIILPLIALSLKLGVVFESLNLISKPDSSHDHETVSEDKPLIQTHSHSRIH